jgi:hypothetical protein
VKVFLVENKSGITPAIRFEAEVLPNHPELEADIYLRSTPGGGVKYPPGVIHC